jgi:sigma-B regulation protein RsbU (phosphoserine phosphatase)
VLSRLKIAPRLALLILLGTGVILAVVTVADYRSASGLLRRELLARARSLALATARQMEVIQRAVEKVVVELTVVLKTGTAGREEVYPLLEDTVRAHEELFGSAVLLVSGEASAPAIPYVFRDGPKIARLDLGAGGYGYETFDWYQMPRELRAPVWTEPYYDEGGGNRIMVTYSVPMFEGTGGEFHGIATGDLALDWLTGLLASMDLPDAGFAFLISRNGTFISHPQGELIMRESIFSIAEELGRQDVRDVGRRMVRQEEGVEATRGIVGEGVRWLAYAPVAGTDWSLGVVFPEKQITAALFELSRTKLVLGLAGAAAMVVVALAIARSISRPISELEAGARVLASGNLDAPLPAPRGRDEVARLAESFASMRRDLKKYVEDLRETTEAKARIENDLRTARTIQLDILPSRFQFDPPRPELDIHALLEAAREVGGDFYDFFLASRESLFVAVADVSGKGVPAAIFMAVSKAYLKAFASQAKDTAAALALLNDELAMENDEAMYLTAFCAGIDLTSGECRFASGGHPPPFILRRSGAVESPLPVKGGLVGLEGGARFELGSFRLERGDMLVAVSDGVLEAEDVRQELYGEERTREALSRLVGKDPREVISALREEVRRFAGEAEQSDDITLLAVRYNGHSR